MLREIEAFGRVVTLAVFHLGFAPWPPRLSPATFMAAVALHRGKDDYVPKPWMLGRMLGRGDTRSSLIAQLLSWESMGGRPPAHEPSEICVHTFGEILDTDDSGDSRPYESAREILRSQTLTALSCRRLAATTYRVILVAPRERAVKAFQQGLNWNRALDALASCDLELLEVAIVDSGTPTPDELHRAIDWPGPLEYGFDSECASLHSRLVDWVAASTPDLRRSFLLATTGGSSLAADARIQVAFTRVLLDGAGHAIDARFTTCSSLATLSTGMLRPVDGTDGCGFSTLLNAAIDPSGAGRRQFTEA